MRSFVTASRLIQKDADIKHYYLASFILGLLSSFAFAPHFLFWLLIPAFSGLLFFIDRVNNKKQAFWSGWWFGWGHFITGLFWIHHALLVDTTRFAWLIPFAVLGLPAILALYMGFAALITYLIPAKKWHKVLCFAIIWVGCEYLRSYLFTGFPWNLIGYSLAFSDNLLQFASITGIYGLSIIVVIFSAMPYTLMHGKAGVKPVIFSCILLGVIFVFGYIRLNGAQIHNHDVFIRIVQSNIKQDLKWDDKLLLQHFQSHIDLSKTKSERKIDYIIWPESAFAFPIGTPGLLTRLKEVSPEHGALITGSTRVEQVSNSFKWWNSIHAINREGEIIAGYDKVHLLPFGEYVPFRSLLPVEKIVPGIADCTAGKKYVTLNIDKKLPSFSPQICYEILFPDNLKNLKFDQWILNVTNDGWFGISAGPHQHFAMARLRAVEQGIPLIRAANTGISAIINAYGQVIAKLNLGNKGVIDGYLPKALTEPTLYSKYGDKTIFLIIGFIISICIFSGRIQDR
jgi:apolipoprotein N-acyltransferase